MERYGPWWVPLLLCAAACSGGSPTPGSVEGEGRTGGAATGSPGSEEPPTETPPPAPRPEEVRFVAADGTTLAATLWASEGAERAVVLVHQLGSERSEWRPFVEALLALRPRPLVLALDLRGHGGSVEGPEGRTLSWREFGPDDWEKLPLDVAAALDFLASRPALRTERIVVVGSSIGGSAAFLTALRDRPYRDPRVDAVGWLSPGRAYRGLDVLSPASRYGRRPFAAFVAEGELPAREAAEALRRVLPRAVVRIYPGRAHGVKMLADAPELLDDVVAFARDPDGFVEAAGAGASAGSGQ